MFKKYLKMDFHRLFHSPTFYISFIGVFFIYIIGTFHGLALNAEDVLTLCWLNKFYSMFIIIFAAGNVAFANTLLEDIEHNFYISAILRGDLKPYIWSKVITCFIGTTLAIMFGSMCYVLTQSFRIPLLLEETTPLSQQIITYDMFSIFMHGNWMWLYFALSSMMIGILGGMLALIAMYLSTIAKNRMFAIVTPVIIYYLLVNYLNDDILSINGLYIYSCTTNFGALFSFLYAIGIAALCIYLFGKLILQQMARITGGIIN